MLVKEDIPDFLSLSQGYEYINTYAPDGKQRLLHFKNSRTAGRARCPYCGVHAHVCGNYSTRLRDMPVYAVFTIIWKRKISLQSSGMHGKSSKAYMA